MCEFAYHKVCGDLDSLLGLDGRELTLWYGRAITENGVDASDLQSSRGGIAVLVRIRGIEDLALTVYEGDLLVGVEVPDLSRVFCPRHISVGKVSCTFFTMR